MATCTYLQLVIFGFITGTIVERLQFASELLVVHVDDAPAVVSNFAIHIPDFSTFVASVLDESQVSPQQKAGEV